MRVPGVADKIDKNAIRCPHCKALAYFLRENQWPSNIPTRLSKWQMDCGFEMRDLCTLFHVAVWKCSGCSNHVILVYPNGLGTEPRRVWPIGSSRSLRSSDLPINLIPKHISDDFHEAALIEELSPKASATLSRRCLQSILQDQFPDKVGKDKPLKKQVHAIFETELLPTDISNELHGIRSIGNDGAHENINPETNQIIDVEPGEASACLDVIEDLVTFCYVKPYRALQRKEAREKKHGKDNR